MAQPKPENQPEATANDETESDAIKKHRRRIFYGSFWSEHPISILGLLASAVCLGALTAFPGGTRKDFWWVAAGVFIFIATIIYWAIDGYLRRHDPTDEEIQAGIAKSIEQLDARQKKMESKVFENRQRQLSRETKDAIIRDLSRFTGQPFVMDAVMFNDEALNFAQDISQSLQAAGWVGRRLGQTTFVPNFCVTINLATDYDQNNPNRIPLRESFIALHAILVAAGFSGNGVCIVPGVPADEVLIRVGSHQRAAT